MDIDNLERLRRKYANSAADETQDPEKRKVLKALFDDVGKRKLPYAGVPTFLDLPFKDSLADLDIAVIGVPMDLGVTNRPGARFGPYHHALKLAPVVNCRVADVGDVPFHSRFDLTTSLKDIESFFTQVVRA